jgi:hypothetical protein
MTDPLMLPENRGNSRGKPSVSCTHPFQTRIARQKKRRSCTLDFIVDAM